jgi:PII-like signaling protein
LSVPTMSLSGEHVLLRVYLRTADRSPHVPTFELLVETARKHGLAGATVLQGIVGLGSRGFSRMSNWSFVQHLPVIVELVDSAPRIAAFVAGPMAELMHTGMATLERANVLLTRHGGPRQPLTLELAQVIAPLSTVVDVVPGDRMKTQNNGILLRVFVGESDRYESQPLHEAILQKVRSLGCAGATVLRGTEGFGAHSVVHKSSLLEMSADLPILVEIVDSEEKIKLLLPHLEEMVTEGMITMEHVVVLLYRDGRKEK